MLRSSSSDSDNGERVRNVYRTSTKTRDDQLGTDESYTYKRKLGDLIFDAHYETGNLGCVDRVDEFEFDLMIRPDVGNPRHHLWFNFSVTNQRPGQSVIFNIVNLSESVRLFNDGLTSVARSKQSPNWLHLHEDQVFYHRSAAHGNRHILSLAFKFSTYDDPHQFALFYPYEFSRMTNFISRWIVQLKRDSSLEDARTRQRKALKVRRMQSPDLCSVSKNLLKYFPDDQLRTRSSLGGCLLYRDKPDAQDRADALDRNEKPPRLIEKILGTSVLNRPIQLVSIRSGQEESLFTRSKLIIACRACGNLDAPASLVCQGAMDFILSDDIIAQFARQKIDFDFIPMLDPDSIVAGNSRTDILGQSPGAVRSRLSNSPGLYSHLIELQKHITELSSARWNRVVFIELKMNINLIGSRIIGSVFENSLRMEQHQALPRLMAYYASDFYLENCEFHKPGKGPPSLLDHTGVDRLDHYRLEVSPFAAFKRTFSSRKYEVYSQEKYLSLGKALVFASLASAESQNSSRKMPPEVTNILEFFHPSATDIDNLVLSDKSSIC